MLSLDHTRSVKFMDRLFDHRAICTCKYQLSLTGTRNLDLYVLIYVTICMSCDCDRGLPVLYTWLNALYDDWCTEYSSIKDRTDRSIWALPHFFQVILCHTCSIWCDRCTFNSNAILLCCICGIKCYLIICLISIFKSQIVILGFQIDKWVYQFILDHLPENSGHLVSIHLY